MNFKKLFSPLMLAIMSLAVIATSCSEKADTIEDKLKEYVSDDATVIAAIDLKRALDAADVTVTDEGTLELPSYVRDLTNDLGKNEKKALNEFLDFKGFEWTNTIYAMNLTKGKNDIEPEGLLIFSVADDDDFAKALEETDGKFSIDKEDGYKTVSNKYISVIIDGHVGFIAISKKGPCKSGKAIEIIKEWKDKASEKPLADWKINYLNEERIAKLLINMEKVLEAANYTGTPVMEQLRKANMEQYAKSYVGVTYDIDGNSTSLSAKIFDTKGKTYKVPGIKNFDTELLKYAGHYDIAAAGLGVGDISNAVESIITQAHFNYEEASMARQLGHLLSNSSIFVAVGPANGINSYFKAKPTNWHAVAAIKFENANKASEAVNLIATTFGVTTDEMGNCTVQAPVDSHYDIYNDSFSYTYMPVYIKRNGQTVTISNQATLSTSGNTTIDKAAFKGKNFALVAGMDKSNPFLSHFNFPFGLKAVLTSTGTSADLTLSLTGISGKLIKNLFEFVTKTQFIGYGSAESIEPDSTYDYSYSDSDSVAVAVDPEYYK